MSDKASQFFYITLHREDDSVKGFSVSSELPNPEEEKADPPAQTPAPADVSPTGSAPSNFKEVFQAFISSIESYRRFIRMTLSLGPVLSAAMASNRIEKFVKAKGTHLSDLSTDGKAVYQLPRICHREFHVHQDEVIAIVEGARHLPEVMTIGLVSAYDAFLGQLLRVVLNLHPEIILTSEKTIKLADLAKFASIDDARSSLIDREIEAVIRSSHQDQFKWMEERFSIPLRTNLTIWPRFVELCERRNLITHTGGVVSAQYLVNCKAHGVDVSKIGLGTKLVVDANYFSEAVAVIYEIGVKLCHVLWRKFAEQDREEADIGLNERCFDLIHARAYGLAESLLIFGTTVLKKHANDKVRRMMIVNLANTVRLQDRKREAKDILEREDWTAVDNEFAICVAAVMGDVAGVVSLMRTIGPKGSLSAESFRSWPVFRGLGSIQQFTAAFEEVFGEPFIAASAVEISQEENATAGADAASAKALLN